MSDLPDPWKRAVEQRRQSHDLTAADPCVRLLHDEVDGLRCDRFGPVCWFYWYAGDAPTEIDVERFAALTQIAGARHWHAHGMSDRGRDPARRRHWQSPQAPDTWVAAEDSLRFLLRADSGQSAGLFVDQRQNRGWVRARSAGTRILNLFAYTGSFGVAALAGGAVEIVQNDVSRAGLDWARENAALNPSAADTAIEYAQVDARLLVDGCRKRGRRFDGVVCDPPSFARGRRRSDPVFRVEHDLEGLVEACMEIIDPGGWLLVSANYGGWPPDAFTTIVSRAVGRRGRVQPAPGPGADCGGAGDGVMLSVVVEVG